MNVNMANLNEIWDDKQKTTKEDFKHPPNKYRTKKFQKQLLTMDPEYNANLIDMNGVFYPSQQKQSDSVLNIQITDDIVTDYLSKYNRYYQISHVTDILKSYISKNSKSDLNTQNQEYEFFKSKKTDDNDMFMYIIIGLLILLFIEKYKSK